MKELTKLAKRLNMFSVFQVTVGGVFTAVPFRTQGVTVTQIGAILHQLRSEQHGFTLTFTPHSNEFMINMDISMKPNTTGVCGKYSSFKLTTVIFEFDC